MSIEKAKKHYLGKDRHKKLNCADAIIKAFTDLDPETKECICKGGGKSEGGVCGALCAAKSILGMKDPEKIKEFERYFIGLAGSDNCKEIRKLKKLSCLGCVEKAAEFLESHQ